MICLDKSFILLWRYKCFIAPWRNVDDWQSILSITFIYINTICTAETCFISLGNVCSPSFEITLCLVRQSSSWALSECLAVAVHRRLFLHVWRCRSELLSQLDPAGGDKRPHCCWNLKTEQKLSDTRGSSEPFSQSHSHQPTQMTTYKEKHHIISRALLLINARLNMHKKTVLI